MVVEKLGLGANPVDGDNNRVTQGGGENRPATTNDGGDDAVKTPRLPRWTRQEILVLIQGKRVAENQVRRGRAAGMVFGLGQIEPKWASISSYCRRHGVNRGPLQCRKRWSNLAGDFKKIKEWESKVKDETESFWAMRNDLRRERKLPGFFDKEVYDILDGSVLPASVAASATEPALALALAPSLTGAEPAEESEPVFDSGRSAAAEDSLFSDFEQEEAAGIPAKTIPAPVPISVSGKLKKPQVFKNIAENQHQVASGAGQGATTEKQPASNTGAGSISQEQRKRRRSVPDEEEEEEEEEAKSIQRQLIEMLERNGKILAAHLEVQNKNFQLDREQRKEHGDSLVAVLNRLADALGRIADKL